MEKKTTLSFLSFTRPNKTGADEKNFFNREDEVPGQTVLSNILNFSRALQIEQSKKIGFVEMILN